MNSSLASLVCNLCLKTFSTKGNLKMHYMVHSGVKPFVCEICKKGFTQKGNLKAHLQRHMDNRQLDHIFCNEMLERAHEERPPIVQYSKPESNNKCLVCQQCNSTFSNEVSLCEHILSSHIKNDVKQSVNIHCNEANNVKNDVPEGHVCSICKEHVSSMSALELHLFVHKTLKPYRGNEMFLNKSVPEAFNKPHIAINADAFNKAHLPINADDSSDDDDDSTSNEASTSISFPYAEVKPYSCQICRKSYYNELSLKIHYKTHMHPYMCKICQKTFSHRCNLELHELAHARHKPYVCEVCDKSFAQKSQFHNHYRKHSGTWKPFTCEICNKSYTSKYYLRTHLDRHKLGLIPIEDKIEPGKEQVMLTVPTLT